MTDAKLIRLVSKLDAMAHHNEKRDSDDGYSTAHGLRIASDTVLEMIGE